AQKEEVFKNSKRGYQFAAQNFQEGLIKGFSDNNVKLTVITSPFISTYPFGYRSLIFKSKSSEVNRNVYFENSFCVNLPFFKEILNNTESKVLEYCKKNIRAEKINIIVYSLNSYLMKIAIAAKRK